MRRRRPPPDVDLSTVVGDVVLPNPVMAASGTAGYGAELASYFDLGEAGAIVSKSLSADPWPGNPAPRVHEVASGMINAVGLQGPGVDHWLRHELPRLEEAGARVVASIWGRTIGDYERAARALTQASPSVVAVEVNISCPNTEAGGEMFAHDPAAAAAAIEASAHVGRPIWAKLSPNTSEIVAVAGAVADAGAAAVTLTNTVIGMVIDTETRRPLLANGSGGLSGPAIRPVAVRAVYETRAAHPHLPIVGVGGVASATDAVEFLLAGAQAVQIGTATFADPRAVVMVRDDLARWCAEHHVSAVTDLIGAAHH
ncbi:MAG: dihydroorotate dehydrogenase [Acidimicrobiales bacterium]